MKNIKSRAVICILLITVCCMLTACRGEEKQDLWNDAVYTEDTSIGKGAVTFALEVEAGDKSVTFTINTDKNNLEEALAEHKLIEGEDGPYGMYIKKVNGILADYDIDQSYWALSESGEPLQTGASSTEINGGEHFEFIYTK